jgi:hypothetical protein
MPKNVLEREVIRNGLLAVAVLAVAIVGCYNWSTTDWHAYGAATLPAHRPIVNSTKASILGLSFDSTNLLEDGVVIDAAVSTNVKCMVDLVEYDEWNWGDGKHFARLMQANPASAIHYAQELEKLPIAKLRIEFLCRSSLGTGVTVAKKFQAVLKKNDIKSVGCSRPFETPTRPGEYYVVVTLEEYYPGKSIGPAQLHPLFCGPVHINDGGMGEPE